MPQLQVTVYICVRRVHPSSGLRCLFTLPSAADWPGYSSLACWRRCEPPHRKGTAPLTADCKEDLGQFLSWLPCYNGLGLMRPQPADIIIEVDSCLTGCGGIAGNEYYHEPQPPFVQEQRLNICQLEMLNIAVAVRLWAATWFYAPGASVL